MKTKIEDKLYLEPEEEKYYPDIVLFVDVETDTRMVCNKEYILDFKTGSYILYSFNENRELKRCIFSKKEEFQNDLMRFVSEYNNILVISHNFDFDVKVLGLMDFLFKNNYEIFKNPLLDSIFYIVFKEKSNNEFKKTIKLMDSFNIFKDKLERLGEAIGIKKIKIDFNNCTKEELEKYCMTDTEILCMLFVHLINFLKNNNISFKISIAGIAFSAYRNNFLEKICINTPGNIRKKERMAYKGGRVECFVIGKVPEKIYYVDINSLYPFCATQLLPVEYVGFYKNMTVARLMKLMTKYYVIVNVDFTLYENCIGIKREIDKSKKLVFPVGNIKNEYLHHSEIELVMKYGKIIRINEVLVYKAGKPLEKYVKHFFNLKQTNKNTSYYLFYKYLLNALYGKFGQHQKLIRKIENPPFADGCYFVGEKNKRSKYMVVLNNVGYLYDQTELDGTMTNIALAGAISALGRSYLFEMMKIAGLENCYYVDTDSLMINERGFCNLLNKNLVGDELGKFKLEKIGNINIYNCKWYELDGKLKIKGVKNIGKQGIVFETKIFKETDDYVEYMQERVERFRTAIRKRRINTQSVSSFIKRMSKKYNKGIVIENNNINYIKPIILNEF